MRAGLLRDDSRSVQEWRRRRAPTDQEYVDGNRDVIKELRKNGGAVASLPFPLLSRSDPPAPRAT
jgi:hypothetical protein